MGLTGKSPGIRKAAVIQLGSKYFNVIIQLIVTMVLARLLTPEEYGTMAVITVFLGAFSIMSDMGIGAAVVQYRNLSIQDIRSLYGFSIVLGFVLAAAFALISHPVALIYNNQRIVNYMLSASPCVMFQSFNMVLNGLLLREKRFKTIGLRLVVTTIGAGAISIYLAMLGAGVYALVANTLLQSMFAFLWNAIEIKIMPSFRGMSSPLRQVGRFSLFQLLGQLLQYCTRNLDTAIIGARLGSHDLGLYNNGYKLAKYPVDYLPAAINPVLKSYYSAMQEDKNALYSNWLKMETIFSFVGALVAALFFTCSEEIVILFFGSKWAGAIPVFRILSLSIYCQMLNSTFGSILEAVKRTDLVFSVTLINLMIMVFLLLIGIQTEDILIVSACVCLSLIIYTVPVVIAVVKVSFDQSLARYASCLIPDIISGIAAAVIGLLATPMINSVFMQNQIIRFMLKAATVVASYFVFEGVQGHLRPLWILINSRVDDGRGND